MKKTTENEMSFEEFTKKMEKLLYKEYTKAVKEEKKLKPITWIGTTQCDYCSKAIKNKLYDFMPTNRMGATLCEECYNNNTHIEHIADVFTFKNGKFKLTKKIR